MIEDRVCLVRVRVHSSNTDAHVTRQPLMMAANSPPRDRASGRSIVVLQCIALLKAELRSLTQVQRVG